MGRYLPQRTRRYGEESDGCHEKHEEAQNKKPAPKFRGRLKKVKAVLITQNGLHRSGNVLLSHSLICSTIAAERLNFRVRNGNGWIPLAIVTEKNDWSSVICAVIDSRHNGLILA